MARCLRGEGGLGNGWSLTKLTGRKTESGSEHFLVDMDCGGTIGACTLEWYSVEEGEIQYVDALTDHYRGDYSGIVLFEGQIYCIITDYDLGTKNLCGVHILPLNDRGEWEVIHTEYFWPSSYHQTFMVEYGMYGYRDGAFVEFDMQDILNGYGTYSRTAERGAYSVSCYPLQIWFEEIDGVMYLFTLDLLSPTGDYLLRACVIREGTAEEVGVWLLHAAMLENIEEAVYVSYTRG